MVFLRDGPHGPLWDEPYAGICPDCFTQQIPVMQDKIDQYFQKGKYAPQTITYSQLGDYELPKGGLFS